MKGVVWCRWLDLHQLPAHYQGAAHLNVLQTAKWHPRSESNTRNPLSEGRRRSSVGVSRLATMAGVEPAQSTFVASFPKSLGPWPSSGCSPGRRARPSPPVWQLSRAHKVRPHTVLITIDWMWRVDLHHHRQVYETCAPLFVLRHRKWRPEKCSHLRLFLFREALELSQLSRRN